MEINGHSKMVLTSNGKEVDISSAKVLSQIFVPKINEQEVLRNIQDVVGELLNPIFEFLVDLGFYVAKQTSVKIDKTVRKTAWD